MLTNCSQIYMNQLKSSDNKTAYKSIPLILFADTPNPHFRDRLDKQGVLGSWFCKLKSVTLQQQSDVLTLEVWDDLKNNS